MSNSTWDLNLLKGYVLSLHGESLKAEISPCLNSIAERQEYARFHFNEAKDSLESFIKTEHLVEDLFRLAFGKGGEGFSEFEENKLKAQAHTLACLQNMHSVLDILSHVIYYGLNLNMAKREREISINALSRWLSENSKFSQLSNLITQLKGHDDYLYLNALVNHSKHKSVIAPSFNFNLRKSGEDVNEFLFPNFSYGNKNYKKRLVYDFLSSEYDRQGTQIILIGNELNKVLASDC
jgi:hypothetical protein